MTGPTLRDGQLTLGTASADITPRMGLALSGWDVQRHARSVHRPLEARVLRLHDGSQTLVLVTLDLLGLSSEVCGTIRARIERELGIPAPAVMLSCSHTHSGPVLPPWRPAHIDAPDETYLAELQDIIVDCVAEAGLSPVPVTIGHGSGTCDLGINRRLPWQDGKVGYPPHADPDGPVDREVGVLRFDDENGAAVAVLVSYGCHPTVSGTSDWVSPDFPGPARTVVEDDVPTAMAAFVLGNCGDVRSDYTNEDGSFRWDATTDLVEEAGRRLGSVAARVAQQIRTAPVPILRIGRASRPVHTVDGQLIEAAEFLAFGIGGAALVSNPAECFSRIGLEVRAATSRPLLFASISNGFFGYVPTEDAYRFGGYEVDMSWVSFGLRDRVRQDTHAAFREGMLAALRASDADAARDAAGR